MNIMANTCMSIQNIETSLVIIHQSFEKNWNVSFIFTKKFKPIRWRYTLVWGITRKCWLSFKTKQNRESTEGYSKSIVLKITKKSDKGLVSTSRTYASPKGTGPGVRRSKRPLSACQNHLWNTKNKVGNSKNEVENSKFKDIELEIQRLNLQI